MFVPSLNKLQGYTWKTLDGVEGSILGAYIEEDSWLITHIEASCPLVNDQSSFLIPTKALSKPSSFDKSIRVNMLSSDLMSMVKLNSHVKSVSEVESQKRAVSLSKTILEPIGSILGLEHQLAGNLDAAVSTTYPGLEFSNLRKTSEIKGYKVKSRQKVIGYVQDFVIKIGDSAWRLDRLVVLPYKWLSIFFGKTKSVNPSLVREVSLADEEIIVAP